MAATAAQIKASSHSFAQCFALVSSDFLRSDLAERVPELFFFFNGKKSG